MTMKHKRHKKAKDFVQRIAVQSIGKIDSIGQLPNEDSCRVEREEMMVVADGAGGSGKYARDWSEFLSSKIPQSPIEGAAEFNKFLESIWEEFYNGLKAKAEADGIAAEFVEQGSYSTLIVMWRKGQKCRWISYGDSAFFVFSKDKKRLKHSNITDINSFVQNPHLVNWKDNINESAFCSGSFLMLESDVLVMCSDAIAQLLMMSYLVDNDPESEQLKQLVKTDSRLSGCYKNYLEREWRFSNLLSKLRRSLNREERFRQLTDELRREGVLLLDDYTMLTVSKSFVKMVK